jgi:hypothetical protein
MATGLSICQAGLLLIGAESINSFSDGTLQSDAAATLYEPTRDAILTRYLWKFSLTSANLARLETSPYADYQYAYQLPPDPQYLRALKIAGRYMDYTIRGDLLLSNEDTCTLTYQYSPDETKYPPYFVSLMQMQMASVFAAAVAQDMDMANAFEARAEREFLRAKSADSQSIPPKKLNASAYPLIAART